MKLNRTTFPARLADLELSILVPEGFVAPPLPEEEPNFDDTTVSAPLLLVSSPVSAVFITVAARPAYADGSVMEWITYLLNHFQITPSALLPDKVGGPAHTHPAILISGNQVQEGMPLTLRVAAFEDGTRFVTSMAMCPDELWPSYGPALEQVVRSIELARPKGPTAALVPGAQVPALGPGRKD